MPVLGALDKNSGCLTIFQSFSSGGRSYFAISLHNALANRPRRFGMPHPSESRNRPRWTRLGLLFVVAAIGVGEVLGGGRAATQPSEASIEVNAAQVTGRVPRYLFGQFIEHEYNTIQGGLWAEMLRDRKFEEGDADRDGISDGWAPEERITDHYWELVNGQSSKVRYFVDRQDYFGGGASQAIELYGSGSNHASIYQIGLQVTRGRRYVFYAYFKRRGVGKAWVEFDKLGGPLYGRKEFPELSDTWQKYTAEFTAPEDAVVARIRIGFQGVGTFWTDSASLMPADNLRGMRRDVVEALKPMRISIMRYPGGCFADYYHWKIGLGPRDSRPEFWSAAWNEWNPNDFGVDEYMDLAKELGFEGHITTNYISGTAEEAAQWVEYANGSAETSMGNLRVRNGHPEPYRIKFWAVGNEGPAFCSGEWTGGTKLTDYFRRFQDYKNAMQKVDPSVRVMASSVGNPDWARDLKQALHVDLLATSIYTGEPQMRSATQLCDLDDFYRKVVAEPPSFARKLEENIRAMGDLLPQDHPFLAITEFNSWWLSEKVDPDYRLSNGLYFAGVFNALLRRANAVFMAEASTTLNVQGILGINPLGVKLTPPYFAYLLYVNHIGSRVLSTTTHGPMVRFNPQLPALDAIATMSRDGNILYLAVVNRAETDDILATIHLKDWTPGAGTSARAFELNGRDKVAANPYGSAENVNIRGKSLTLDGVPFTYRFPAHSATVLELSGQRTMEGRSL